MTKIVLTEEQQAQMKAWDLPYVEDARAVEDTRTNALNRRPEWKYEPPEPEPEIIPPTAEEIEAIRQAAYEEGFAEGKQAGHAQGLEQGTAEGLEQGTQQGHEQGMEQGLEEGREQIRQQSDIWQKLIDQLQLPIQNMEKELEKELVELSVSLARAVVRTEVQTNKDMIFQALSEGLKVLPINQTSYHIHLNPEDINLLKSHFSEEEIARHHWHLVESPGMSRGGCDISTEHNAVDVSVERRVREVLDKFLLEQGLGSVHPAGEPEP